MNTELQKFKTNATRVIDSEDCPLCHPGKTGLFCSGCRENQKHQFENDFRDLYNPEKTPSDQDVLNISSRISKKNCFSQAFEKHLNYFSSDEFKNLANAEDMNLPDLEDAKDNLISLFSIFLDGKVKLNYHIFLLDFNEILKELTFEKLTTLIVHYPIHYSMDGWPSLELPNYCLKFIHEFYFKKKFFFMEKFKAIEAVHFNPIYRFKARQKNQIILRTFLQEFKLKREDLVCFIKNSLEKFIPNSSDLWHVENHIPHLTIFRLLKTLFEYSILTKQEVREIKLILLDKAGIMKNLEKIVETEQNLLRVKKHSIIHNTTTTSLMQEYGKIPFQASELEVWAQSLMKIRQYYAEIFVLGFLSAMDEELVVRLNENLSDVEAFSFDASAKELSDEDRCNLNTLESKIKFDSMEIFNEENGSSLLRVFFRYILVSNNSSQIQITPKTKAVVKTYLGFFSNVYDMNLSAMLVMGDDEFRFLKDVPEFLKEDAPYGKDPEVDMNLTGIKNELQRCGDIWIEKCLLEKGEEEYTLNEFLQEFTTMRSQIMSIRLPETQLLFFMKGFFWVFLHSLRKYKEELSLPENSEKFELILNFMREIMSGNLFFQAKCIQARFHKLINPENKGSSFFNVSMIGALFERFPSILITNQTYLINIFEFLQNQPHQTDEDYKRATKCLGFWQYYLNKRLYAAFRFVPHYDFLCLEQLFSDQIDLGQIELFAKPQIILEIRKNFPRKFEYFLKILEILTKASKTRYSKHIHLKMTDCFKVSIFKEIFQVLEEESRGSEELQLQNFMVSIELRKVLLGLLRNIYIKKEENIFDDPKTQISYKDRPKQKKKELVEEDKNDELLRKTEKKKKNLILDECRADHITTKAIWEILYEELTLVMNSLETPLLTEEDKRQLKFYLHLLSRCVGEFIKKEILSNYVFGRKTNFRHLRSGETEKSIRHTIENIHKLIKEDFVILQKAFQIREFKAPSFSYELDVHGVSGKYFKPLLKDYHELEARCQFYCKEIKVWKKPFSSGDIVKKFSNKLEDRQKSVYSPYEIVKDILKNDPKNKVGKIFASVYESYKLKRLSTYSSIKKSQREESNHNVFMKILQESEAKKDNIAKNFCEFMVSEIFKTNTMSEDVVQRNQPRLKSSLTFLEIAHSQESQVFNMFNRNYKYMLLEFFTNVLFHATNTCQKQLFALISENFKVLDIIWEELIFNLSYIYNQTHHGKHWHEAFMRVILLIKTLQYFCEENNVEFKKWIKKGLEFRAKEEEMTKFEQIKEIFRKFYHSNDWGQKNFNMMKRKSLFPIIQALYDFLSEIICGPCVENQKILINEVFDFRMIGNLLNTFDEKSLDMMAGKSSESASTDNERSLIEIKEFQELKSSIADCLLICCEGGNQEVMESQSKKINLFDILDTIVRIGKILGWSIVKRYGKKEFGPCYKTINYLTYQRLKKNFRKSKFYDSEKDLLDVSLKLFIYLQNLSEQSFTLKNILESKVELANRNIEKHSRNNVDFCSRRKKNLELNEEEREQDLTIGYIIKFLTKISAKVEIQVQTEEKGPKFIFFKSSSDFGLLSEETKDTFLKTVDRTSHETKIHNLIASCNVFDKEIHMIKKLSKKHPFLMSKFNDFRVPEIFLFVICALINILIFVNFVDADESNDIGYLDYSIQVLGTIEFFLSLILLIIWMIIRFPIEKNIAVLNYCEDKGLAVNQINRKTNMSLILGCLYDENFFRVLLLHIFCTALGPLSFGFYAIDIFSIINLSDTFQYLAKSISQNGQQLMFTFYMALIFIYVFSVWTDLYFADNLVSDDTKLCGTSITCFFAILNTGFTNGSGLSGMLSAEILKKGNIDRYFGYLLIDLLFFCCVNMILLNIVFGIIVDTFGQLREKSQEFEEDSRNYCFICQINKRDYEKTGKVFNQHLKEEHNIWNYANFIIYIKNKTEKDCNGLESKIFKKIHSGDMSWVPFYDKNDKD